MSSYAYELYRSTQMKDTVFASHAFSGRLARFSYISTEDLLPTKEAERVKRDLVYITLLLVVFVSLRQSWAFSPKCSRVSQNCQWVKQS
jgi:hypothetical protein